MNTLIERVEFQAVAPKRALPGLEYAERRLEALAVSLNAINQRLSSVTTLSAFKRTTKGIEDEIKRLESLTARKTNLSLKQVTERLGLPTDDVRQYILRTQEKLTQDIAAAERKRGKLRGAAHAATRAELRQQEKAMAAELQSLQSTFRGPAMQVRSAPAAARVLAAYQKSALEEVRQFSHAQAATLQSLLGGGAVGPVGSVDVAALAAAAKANAEKKTTDGQRTTDKEGGKKRKRTAVTAAVPADAKLTETKVIKAADRPDRTVRRYEDPRGNVYETTTEEGVDIRNVARDRQKRRAERDLKRQLKAMQTEARTELRGVNTAAGIGAFRRRYTDQARALLAGKEGRRYLDAQLEPLVEAFIGQSLPDLIQKQIVQSGKASQRLRTAGERNMKRLATDATRSEKARQKRWQADVAAERLPRSMMKLLHASPTIEQMQAADAAKAAKGPPADAHVRAYQAAQKEAKALAAEQARLRKETQLLSGDFVHNTLKVTAWTASVGVLYGALGMLQHGFTRTVEIGAQMARLDQVFLGVGGSTRQLTADVLHLAAVNGRSTDEAMQAAVQWSRMGLTRRQVNEAVRVSLMAANVAEITAAEATDHLQAIMRNYGLEVGQLGSVLGELNEVSNTYNVTNAEMLAGISRTASAAKQAGLPLQELVGILGAVIGATKQSGANIGNAVKTMIVALSNPELQEKLRTQFGFEVTTGGEHIKSMSQILGDLYVRYQKLTQIEQQSMLFSVAGKFQANRLAAVLDNYVRAQVLAINAQLDLNSAEAENQKILATLKAQLTGVASEWEKFVVVQSNRGPVQVLNETARALRGVLSLMNTGPGSLLTTGVLGLATAASARALLSGLTARQTTGPGFLSRTGGTVMREASALNTAANATIFSFVRGRNAGGIDATKLGLLDKLVFKTNVWGEAALRVAKNSQTATPALRAFFGAFGLGLKAVSLATVALAEFAVPLLIIGGGVMVFNRALDALGVTSDRATDRLSRLNGEAERARAAAGAMGQAVQLMTTAQQAFGSRGRSMPEAEVRKLLRGVAEVSFLDEQDAKVKQRQTDELEKQLLLLHQQKNVAAIQELIAQRIAATQEMRRRQMQAELAAQVEQQAVLRGEIARLESRRSGLWSWLGAGGREKNLTEKRANLSEVEGRKLRLIQDEEESINDELEKRLAYNERHQAGLERQKVTLEAIAGIYEQIRTLTPMDKAMVQSAKLTAQIIAETEHIARLQAQMENQKPGQPVRDRKVAELREQRAVMELERAAEQARFDRSLSSSAPSGSGMEGFKTTWKQFFQEWASGSASVFIPGQMPASVQRQSDSLGKLKELDARLRQNREDEQRARAGTLPGLAGQDNYLSLNRQMTEAAQRRQQQRVERDGLDAGRQLREQATRFGLGQQRGAITTSAHDYGRNETARNLRQQAALQERINELMAKQNRTAEEYGELTDAIQRKREMEISLVQRYHGILRDINQLAVDNNREMMKSFFGAGPAEMLRKLAAFRRSLGGGMSQGEFFGMSPGMREDYGKMPGGSEWNPEMQALRRELKEAQDALRDKGKMWSDGTLDWTAINDGFLKVTDLLKAAIEGLDQKILKALPTDLLTTAGQTLSTAAEKLDRAAEKMLSAAALPEGAWKSGMKLFKTPALPQGGGVGGGRGFGG